MGNRTTVLSMGRLFFFFSRFSKKMCTGTHFSVDIHVYVCYNIIIANKKGR